MHINRDKHTRELLTHEEVTFPTSFSIVFNAKCFYLKLLFVVLNNLQTIISQETFY